MLSIRIVKNLILTPMLSIYCAILKQKRVNSPSEKITSVALLPPADKGSLGDEAMLTAVIEYFKDSDRSVSRIGICSFGETPCCIDTYPEIEIIPLGAKLSFAKTISHYDAFYCLGADMMDGFYNESTSIDRLKLVEIASQTGAESAVLGFSFNQNPKTAVIRAFQALPRAVRLCAREPISQARLLRHLNRRVELVADLAFLLQPRENSEIISAVRSWAIQEKTEGRVIVGINANARLLDEQKKQRVEEIAQAYVDTLSKLYAEKYKVSFIFIPHDFRKLKNEVNDWEFSQIIFEALPPEIQEHCMCVPTPCSAAEIKTIAAEVDVVLSGRMHLAIACLGQCTPTVCLTYQGKFEGLFRHFELEGMTIEPKQIFQGEVLENALAHLIENRAELRQHIKEKLPQIKQLSQANFGTC